MPSGAIKVHGLRELARDLGRADKTLKRDLQKDLAWVAKAVADRAADDARGLYGDRAARFMRPRVRGASAFAESRARSKGVRPNFGSLIMGVLLRARSAKWDEATRRLERTLDRLMDGLARG